MNADYFSIEILHTIMFQLVVLLFYLQQIQCPFYLNLFHEHLRLTPQKHSAVLCIGIIIGCFQYLSPLCCETRQEQPKSATRTIPKISMGALVFEQL